MNKDSVRRKLIDLVSTERDAAQAAYDEHLQASKPVHDGATVADEEAQTWSEAEIADDLEGPLRAAEARLAALEAIDFGPKDAVEAGAIVTVSGRHFVIGVATDHFTCEGVELIGISPSAPFYQAIDGLGKSDTAEFRGQTLRIDGLI